MLSQTESQMFQLNEFFLRLTVPKHRLAERVIMDFEW
jgi:hypothetical protein